MQPLPAIELIRFFDWVDLNRCELIPNNITIEEIFLNRENEDKAQYLAKRYIADNPQKVYPDTDEGRFERFRHRVYKPKV